jgi:hypothetical protein
MYGYECYRCGQQWGINHRSAYLSFAAIGRLCPVCIPVVYPVVEETVSVPPTGCIPTRSGVQ